VTIAKRFLLATIAIGPVSANGQPASAQGGADGPPRNRSDHFAAPIVLWHRFAPALVIGQVNLPSLLGRPRCRSRAATAGSPSIQQVELRRCIPFRQARLDFEEPAKGAPSRWLKEPRAWNES